jgi:PPP family 3-phenylpropionic acid transporter
LTSLGSDASIVGLAGALAALTEVPVLFTGNRIVRKVGGLWNGVVLGALAYAARWFILSFTVTPLTATLTQALHGFSFGLFYVAGVAFVDANTPEGLSATAQSLFFVAMWGLGAAAGSVLGGTVYQNFGPIVLFQLCGVCSLLAIGLLFGARPASQRAMPPLTPGGL